MMNVRIAKVSLLVTCIVALGVTVVQRRQLDELRTEYESAIPEQATKRVVETAVLRDILVKEPPTELLRLRGEVSGLRNRQRELEDVADENTRLRLQVEQRQANASTNASLPPGYKLRSQAQFVGYGTPEQTLESFLWAIHNKDTNGVFTALTPESLEPVKRELAQLSDTAEMFKELAGFAGMLVVDRATIEDGVVELKVEIAPGLSPNPTPIPFAFRRVGSEWKLCFE